MTGEKDKAEKVLEDYNDVFADIYNTLLFGNSYLDEDGLEMGATESIYKAEQGELKAQRRDVLKIYRGGSSRLLLCSFGIENQSGDDKTMPLRVMGYDCASYRQQLINGERLSPVVTIVLNFGTKRWNTVRGLHEMLDIPEELAAYVQDYRILVFDIAYLEDDTIERFTSDFKMVAKFFKYRREGKLEQIMSDKSVALKHVEAVMDLLKVFTNEKRYEEIFEESFKARVEKGEEIYMCWVYDAIEQKGIEKGIEKNLVSLVTKGLLEKEVAAQELGMTTEQFEELLQGSACMKKQENP